MGNGKNRRQLFDLSQAKAYMRTMLVASGCKRLLDQGKIDEPAGSVLHAQAHHRRDQGKHVRRTERVRHDHRRRRSAARLDPRRAAPVRREPRRDGRQHHAHRQGRHDRLLADGLGRLRHPLDRRAGGDRARPQTSATPSSSCMSKKAPSGSGSTKTASGKSTTASSPTAAASRRAACAGCCTACTTN